MLLWRTGRWLGLALGMLGAGLVLSGTLGHGGGFVAVAACVVALLGIAVGTPTSSATASRTTCAAPTIRFAAAGAVPLPYLPLRRGDASRVASLFFLAPPTTAMTA